MKKLIILIVALLGCMLTVLLVNPTITYVESDGYVVTTATNISSALSSASGEKIQLHELNADDLIYATWLDSYDYGTKTSLDLSYPMYTNNGATLNFLSEDYWLVSNEFIVLETYEDLFLSDGSTYNSDLSQADADEFILVSLSNGLYMNAQTAVFSNQLYDTTIPANSIIKFESTQVSFYEYSNGELIYTFIGEVNGATLYIGDNEYEYTDFLEVLGLLEEAIDKMESGDDQEEIDELITNIRDILDIDMGSTSYQNASSSVGDTGLEEDDTLDQGDSYGAEDEGNANSGSVEGEDTLDGSGSQDKVESQSDGSDSDKESVGGELEEGDADTDEEDTPDDNDDDKVLEDGEVPEGEDGEGYDSGEVIEPEYERPSIYISDLSSWVYAINGTLNYTDNSSTIRKGVSFTIYANLAGANGNTSIDEYGNEYYSATGSYVPSSAAMRKTYYSSQEITLDGLEPGQEYYIQYTYSYTEEVEDETTGEKVYTSISVVSDYYVISTMEIDECELPTILLTYDTEFATYSNRMALDSLYIENDSVYDAEDTSFENFQLNILPYVNKLIFTMDSGEQITITSTTLKKAMVEGGVDYLSTAGGLSSNGIYNYTVTAEDKYGNVLDLNVNGDDSCTGTVYTSKVKPTVTVETVENITDSLTIKITVTDTDGSLEEVDGEVTDMQLLVTNTSNESTYLTGTWGDGTSFASDTTTNLLTLEDPYDGKEYYLTFDCLAYARTYTFGIYGNYDPQPDDVTEDTIDSEENLLFGSEKIYTASMTAGYVDITMETINTTDKGAEIGFTITKNSETELLALLDELRITITDTNSNNEEAYVVLTESELSQIKLGDEGYTYDPYTESVVISSEDGITVELVGKEEYFTGKSLWEALLVQKTTVDDVDSYSTAVQVKITIEDGLLETYTTYEVTYEPMVIKSGVEYILTTVMSNTKFMTKKLEPIVTMEDSFVANDVIEFINLDVTDIDGAITGDGVVDIYVYQGETRLQMASIYVSDDPQNVRFEGLTPGIEYTVEIVALAYNNASGYTYYQATYTLESYTIEAGSDIKSEITLNSLEYVYNNRTAEALLTVTGETCASAIADTDNNNITNTYLKWSRIDSSKSGRWTEYYSLEEMGADEYEVLELDYKPTEYESSNSAYYQANLIYFYDKDYKQIDTVYVSYGYGANVAMVIPENAVYVRFGLGYEDTLEEIGFRVYGYDLDAEDSLGLTVSLTANDTTEASAEIYINGSRVTATDYIQSNTYVSDSSTGATLTSSTYRLVYMLPVTPGDVYLSNISSTSNAVYLYNEQGEYVGNTSAFVEGALYTIPENIYYISILVQNTYNFDLYKVATAQGEAGAQYELSADIYVYDKKQYLFDTEGNSTVWYTLERADSINADEEDYVEVYVSGIIDLYELSEEEGYSTTVTYTDTLDPNCSYRISVKAIYNGAEITLTTQDLDTDSAYIFINNAADFAQIYSYPYANFLVTSDITINNGYYNMTFYGTIDFDGHSLTTLSTTRVITTLGTSGVIKNLVYEVNNGYVVPLVHNNYGTIENIIVKTSGTIKAEVDSNRALIAVNNNATIQNFIIELGGDVYLNYSYSGLVAGSANYGIIQNGYIYTTSTSYGVIYQDSSYSTYSYRAGIAGFSHMGTNITNIYTVFDSYIENEEDFTTVGFSITGTSGADVSDIYHIGDFYDYNNGKTTTMLTTRRIMPNASQYASNIWHVTSNTYSVYNTYDNVTTASIPMVSDASWQSSILDDAFDVEGTISMGFYPRLNLPTELQQYQTYRTLPSVIQSTVPTIVWDEFIEGTAEDNNTVTVSIYMENPNEYIITDIAITGLNTLITSQGKVEDNLYEVVLAVSVSTNALYEEYVSSYTVESFTYNNGGISRTIPTEYETVNIEFYKTISSVAQWTTINNNMDWNYRLKSNLEFDSYDSPGSIMLNGSTTSMTTTTTFTGKIDGNGYTISGIELINVDRAYVIYNLGAQASISNLYVEDLTITASTTQNGNNAGFIRYGYTGSSLEDVHFEDVSIIASGTIGVIESYGYSDFTNCTVNDASITLKYNALDVVIGGIIGYSYNAVLQNCYVKDITVSAYDVNSCTGIGGMVGSLSNGQILNCYAEGTISTDAMNIGGIVGKSTHSYNIIESCISMVEINTLSSNVGGITGYISGRAQNTIALGDIMAGSISVHRISGFKSMSDNFYYTNYAYEGQMVNLLTSEDNDDATELLSYSDLMMKKTWVDTIGISSSQWDFSSISDGELPQLYYKDTDILLPGQEDGLDIPGGDSLSVEVLNADVLYESGLNGETSYYVDVVIDYEEMTDEEIIAAIESKSITFSIEGMAMTDAGQEDGSWSYSIEQYSDSAVRLYIYTTEYENAYDTYKLVVADSSNAMSSTVMIDYGESLFFEIYNLADWNSYMESHARTVENFKIMGVIDFQNTNPLANDLMLGQLVGGTSTASFININYYTTTVDGGNWITSCNGIVDIDFIDCVSTVKNVPTYQAMATLIGTCNGDFRDATVSGVEIYSNNSYGGGIALIYQVNGNVTNLTIEDVYVYSEATTTSARAYAAGIVCYLAGYFSDITVEDVVIDCAYSNYVGSVFGYVQGGTGTGTPIVANNITLTNIEVNGRELVGGLLGSVNTGYSWQNVSGDNISVTAQGNNAGGLAGQVWNGSCGYSNENISIINSSVVSVTNSTSFSTAYRTGGLVGYWYSAEAFYNLTVENTTVEGYGRVGGVMGYRWGGSTVYGIQVIGCTINQYYSGEATDATGAGAVYGASSSNTVQNVVVRDTTVSGDDNVGGIVGYIAEGYRLVVYNAYIAEDVMVVSSGDNAGGIAGYVNYFYVNQVAMGATVIADGSNAGGLVGYLYGSTTTDSYKYIEGVYVRGSVTSSNNTAGLIGYCDADTPFTTSSIAGVIVANELISSGTINPIINYADYSSITSGNIAIWDNMLVNGKTAEEFYTVTTVVDASTTTSEVITPTGVSFVTAEDFLLKSFYTTYKATYIDDTYLITDDTEITDELYKDLYAEDSEYSEYTSNIYMPFITDRTEGTVLANTVSYGETSTGILRPEPGESTGATVVYTSGVDTINIESKQDTVTIQIGNDAEYTYTFQPEDKMGDTYNVITLKYDFSSNITVDGTIYTASDFITKVLTYGSLWYYIDEGGLYYGASNSTAATLSNLSDSITPIHLWQGKMLSSDGKIYSYGTTSSSWSEVTLEYTYKTKETDVDEDGNITIVSTYDDILATAVPVFDNTSYDVYYNFTIDSEGGYHSYRTFSSGSMTYNVYTAQGTINDAYVLATQNGYNYFALVTGETGELISYATPMSLGTFKTTGIDKMTNSFLYTGSVIAAQYDTGEIMVVNYTTGTVISDTSTLTQYAANTLSTLFSAFSFGSTDSNSSYGTSADLLETYITSGGTGTGTDSGEVNDNSQAVGEGEETATTDEGELADGDTSNGEGLVIELPSTDSQSNTSEDGTSDENNLEDGTLDDDELEDGTSANDGLEDGVTGDTSDERGEEDEMDSSDGATGGGTANSDGSSTSDSVSESGTAMDAGESNGSGTSSISGTASTDGDASGYEVAYNPYTGNYEVFESTDISSTGIPMTTSVNAFMEMELELFSEDSELGILDTNGGFVISEMFANKLSDGEKQGLILLLIVTGLGVMVVTIMNVKIRNKRR